MRSSYWNTHELLPFPTKRIVDHDMKVRATGRPFHRWLTDRDVEEVAVKHVPAAQQWNISEVMLLFESKAARQHPHTSIQCSAIQTPDLRR